MPGTRCGPCSRTWIDDRFEQRFGAEIVPVWGQTELGGLAASGRSGDRDRPSSCVGSPLPGTDVEIRDPEGRALPSDSIGEIHVRSPWVMRGYWGQPKLSGQVLRDGWVATGDLGYLDAAGRLFFSGRLKAIIERAGENISALRARGGDRRASRRRGVCLLQRSRTRCGTEEAKAVVVPRTAASLDLPALVRFSSKTTRGLQGSPLLGGLRRAAPDALLEGRLRRARRSA